MFTLASLMSSVLVISVHTQGDSGKPFPSWLKSLLYNHITKLVCLQTCSGCQQANSHDSMELSTTHCHASNGTKSEGAEMSSATDVTLSSVTDVKLSSATDVTAANHIMNEWRNAASTLNTVLFRIFCFFYLLFVITVIIIFLVN